MTAPVPEQAVTAAKAAIHGQVCSAWRSHDEARDLASAQAALEAAAPAIREAERQRYLGDVPSLIIKVDGEITAEQAQRIRERLKGITAGQPIAASETVLDATEITNRRVAELEQLARDILARYTDAISGDYVSMPADVAEEIAHWETTLAGGR